MASALAHAQSHLGGSAERCSGSQRPNNALDPAADGFRGPTGRTSIGTSHRMSVAKLAGRLIDALLDARFRLDPLARRRHIESPRAALEAVIIERPVDPLPKVRILDRHHAAKTLPAPTVVTPLLKTAAKTSADVAALGDQRDARWLVERFESTNDGQEFQPLARRLRLAFGDREPLPVVDRLEHKTPLICQAGGWAGISRGLGKQ